MKILEPHNSMPNTNNIELSVKKKQEDEKRLEGTIKPRKGDVIWEINKITGIVKKADYKRDTTAVLGAKIPAQKLIIREGCVYIPAHNKSAALKRYKNNQNQSEYYYKEPLLKFF